MPDKNHYLRRALSLGAEEARLFQQSDIVYDTRPLLKCLFGCGNYRYTCPIRPGSPSLEQYREMLSRYEWGIIVHGSQKSPTMEAAFRLEREAFADGYYLAFALSGCQGCQPCAIRENQPCRFPGRARPQFYGVGIDVFKTVHGLGMPLETLRDAATEPQNWYAAVFIE